MKVKTLSRKAEDFTRERPTDLQPVTRSTKPLLYPFEKAREYVRAVNAVKLDKHFAKPFVGNLEGHCDGAVLSCGDDKVVKLWTLRESQAARATYLSTHTLTDIDMHWDGELFATAGTEMQIWDVSRAKPTNSYTWGSGSFTRVRFNPVTMQTRANACTWNPMEAFNFVLASEDHNLYTFDMRKPERALLVHEDHVVPVLDVDFAPTGTEFASGSYDRSIRVVDAKFVLSGSVDANIWKAKANAKLGALIPREETKAQYSEALVERHKHLPEVRRIVRKQHVPKSILKAKRAKDHMKKAAQRKDETGASTRNYR
ncbi:WD40-repeat-containing domain protein [Pavlovales sp. CCMP2436]|nr:WD40-repeat-containing domain protein [Pavlovales sp. CCMP2436]